MWYTMNGRSEIFVFDDGHITNEWEIVFRLKDELL